MYKYDLEDVFVFNEKYFLKNDKKRYLLLKRDIHDSLFPDEDNPTEDINTIIHPLLALFFTLFNGRRSVKDVVEDYSKLTGIEINFINKFTEKTLNEILSFEGKGKFIKFDNHLFYIPLNIILKSNKLIKDTANEVDFRSFLIPKKDLDLHSFRYYSPLDCIFEVNFLCYTDCVYCYADRRKQMQCSIPIERMKELIKEARDIGMRAFDLCGGELFLYDKWDVLLEELLKNDFNPYISTKIPLSEEVIRKLKNIGVKAIQISMDSINKAELKKIVKVDGNYLDRLIDMIKCLEKEDFEIFINGQISNLNNKPENVKKMLDYLLTFNNIRRIKLGAIGYSFYKPPGNYEKITPSLSSIKNIEEIVNTYKAKYKNVAISFSGYSAKDSYIDEPGNKEKRYSDRAKCSGNFYAFIILPDGKVTICEELYFHPKFIIGDLKTQSIEEVWNSERAIELYQFSKKMIQEDSACKTCERNDQCHHFKGVCWKEIIFAYGGENWNYPDPKCPYAPEPYNRFWLE